MKHRKTLQSQKQNIASASLATAQADSNQRKNEFKPPTDEVAKRAYFSYVSQGSLPGQDVQHWLEAEVQILAEHNLAQSHGLPAQS